MNKFCILMVLALAFSLTSVGQYYYKDILSNQELTKTMAKYKENKVKTVNIKSFEDDGSESEGFFCQKKINKTYTRTELFTRSNISARSLFVSTFNEEGLILSTSDSSEISSTHNKYTYDDRKRIKSILSQVRSQDDDFLNSIVEEHIYEYADNNLPVRMIRVKNYNDSTTIHFALDEKNNIAIEKDSKSGTKFYYYYDAKNRLTDIVQANDFRTNLTPDYIFEYGSNGMISQMTVTEEGGKDYFVWKYNYENGLRTREKCYTKTRKLLGSVEYTYK